MQTFFTCLGTTKINKEPLINDLMKVQQPHPASCVACLVVGDKALIQNYVAKFLKDAQGKNV